jgi:hypothetical protein
MKRMWQQFMSWVRDWTELLSKAHAYRDALRVHADLLEKFQEISAEIGGYGGHHYLDVAIQLARRCQGAELALKRLAAAAERELEAAGIPYLAPAEIERLAMLAEECCEVVQAVGKVLRHGWDSQSPYGGKTNRVTLEREIGNVRAIVNMMLDAKDLRLGDIQSWQRGKRAALPKWTHFQDCSMPREEQLAMMRAIGQ